MDCATSPESIASAPPQRSASTEAEIDVLRRSFIHFDGVGAATEQKLYRAGVDRWTTLLDHSGAPPRGFGQKRFDGWKAQAEASLEAYERGDHRYFSGALPNNQLWRAFDRFRARCAYLDIETAGWGRRSYITVVGLYDGERTRSYVRGQNLGEVTRAVGRYDMFVTFNGNGFDLPHLERAFPQTAWDQLHIDLRSPLAALGHKGGLKAIERAFGLDRDDDISGMTGFDAIKLWERYRRGYDRALELLLRYNAADIENLEVLAVYAVASLREQLLSHAP